MWPFKRNNPATSPTLTLVQALDELTQIGVALSPGVSIDDLLASLSGDPVTSVDKVHLLCALGGEAEERNVGCLSRDIWHFDAECISDPGDYVRLAERFMVLAGGCLPLANLADEVDIGSGVAWLEFDLEGQRFHWDLEVDNDWMAPGLYTHFQSLLGKRSAQRFMICALGQDSLVLCGDEAKRKAISRFLDLEFHWE